MFKNLNIKLYVSECKHAPRSFIGSSFIAGEHLVEGVPGHNGQFYIEWRKIIFTGLKFVSNGFD